MSEQEGAFPDYDFNDLRDDDLLQAIPEACRKCPVMHDLALDYVVAGIERTRILNCGQQLMDERMRMDTVKSLDECDELLQMIHDKITEVYMTCHAPLKLRASRDGVTHMVHICTSPVDNTHSNSAQVEHHIDEE